MTISNRQIKSIAEKQKDCKCPDEDRIDYPVQKKSVCRTCLKNHPALNPRD